MSGGRRPPWWPDDEAWPPSGGAPRGWGPRGRRRRGFGCLFAVFFLVVMSTFVVFASTLLGALGLAGAAPGLLQVAAVVVLTVGLLLVVAVSRVARGTAGTLDRLVEAAGRVETGDLAARVEGPARGPRPLRDLVRGFNTMAARLETDERERRSLLADVSHELRTPLAVLQGNLEAILDGVRPADPAHLEALLEETRVLGRLVEDLRTVSLSEAGTLPLHREPTDLEVLLADAVAGFGTAAEAAGVRLEVDVEGDLPILEVDPVRIREVVGNLVANALRATPSGGSIRVRAGLADPAVEVRVEDTGSGIAAEMLPHVFDRFWKTPESRGSGLGLAIARNLVVAHGGTVSASSEPGRGTTIRFTLPTGAS